MNSLDVVVPELHTLAEGIIWTTGLEVAFHLVTEPGLIPHVKREFTGDDVRRPLEDYATLLEAIEP